MKLSEIKVGKTYTDGKGNARFVISITPGKMFISTGIYYRIVQKRLGPYLLGSEHTCNKSSFARWARKEL